MTGRFRVVIDRIADKPAARAFDVLAECLRAALAEMGAYDGDGGREIILGMVDAWRAVPADAIIYNAEQIVAGAYWKDPRALRDHVFWDFSAANIPTMRKRGVRLIIHCPPGYMNCMERIAPAAETTDVLFYGAMNQHRDHVLGEIKRAGLRVRHLENCFGADLDAEIARAKIVLNLHYYPDAAHEIIRTGFCFANRKCVVSEPGADGPGEALARAAAVVVPPAAIPAACLALARDDARRAAQAARGYARWRREDFSASVRAAVAASGAA